MIANPFGRRAQEILTADANSGVLNVDFEAPTFEAPTFVNPTPDPKMKDLGYSQIAVSSRAACGVLAHQRAHCGVRRGRVAALLLARRLYRVVGERWLLLADRGEERDVAALGRVERKPPVRKDVQRDA